MIHTAIQTHQDDLTSWPAVEHGHIFDFFNEARSVHAGTATILEAARHA